MTKALDLIEKELNEKKKMWLEKINNLGKPYAQMTKAERQQIIDDPHFESHKHREYTQELEMLSKAKMELYFLRNRIKL